MKDKRLVLFAGLMCFAFAAAYVASVPEPMPARAKLAEYAVNRTVQITVVEGDKYYTGSGVFISSTGYVLTCAHLFSSTTSVILVEDKDGNTGRATMLGIEKRADLALLDSGFNDAPFAPLAAPDQVLLGQDVLIVGNPLGFSFSVCHGIISALNRDSAWAYNQTQTDAMVAPGNSGGPAFDNKGRIVGIVVAFVSVQAGVPANSGISLMVSAGQIREFLTRTVPKGD
jgi:S1-C subfamily serine protease